MITEIAFLKCTKTSSNISLELQEKNSLKNEFRFPYEKCVCSRQLDFKKFVMDKFGNPCYGLVICMGSTDCQIFFPQYIIFCRYFLTC